MRKFYLFFGFLLSLGLSVFIMSCNESTVDPDLYGSVSGTVKASGDGIPLEGVSITTNPGVTSAVVTNSDGFFNLGQVLIGDYSISVEKEDYTPTSRNIKVQDGKESIVEIVMQIAQSEFTAPSEPTYVAPLDASIAQPTVLDLVWNAGETETGDTLRYDVVLFKGGDDFEGTKVIENILDTTFTVSGLEFETSYRWKVVARNRSLYETEGREWKFKTEDFPQNGFFFVKDTLDSKDIYSWDLSPGHLVRLTNNGNAQIYPRVSPNDQWVAYSSNISGEYHIYTIDTKGNELFQVTSDKPVVSYNNGGSGFSWSPDGDYIIYGWYDELIRINHDGTGGTLIAKAPVNRHFKGCDWNKYTDKIVVLAQGVKPYENEIYLMDPDGSNMQLLVDDVAGTLSGPSFSVDGQTVIFSKDDSGLEADDGRQLDARIYSINVDGSNLTDLSEDNKTNGTNDLQAQYSQTGGKIIFMNAANDGDGLKNIWIMDTDGENREQIISNAEMPEWINP